MIPDIALVHMAVSTAAFYNSNFECLLPTDVYLVLVSSLWVAQLLSKIVLHGAHSVL